jgi:hypothetical protein
MPRPITRIVSSSPVTYLQLRTHAPAVASIAESLAGRVRYLYELAAGIPAVEADGVVTPLNPQGRVGVDRSGPPWGDALQHPIWIWEGTPASTGIYGEKPIASFTTSGTKASVRARLMVRPFQNEPLAPYSLGQLTVRGIRTAGAGTATATIRTYAGTVAEDPARTATLTMASSATMASANVLIPLVPGYVERLIEIEATASVAFAITHMSINQIVRRSH